SKLFANSLPIVSPPLTRLRKGTSGNYTRVRSNKPLDLQPEKTHARCCQLDEHKENLIKKQQWKKRLSPLQE
ncbi:unnamed protein product, partial [Gulo gulo]